MGRNPGSDVPAIEVWDILRVEFITTFLPPILVTNDP